MLKLLKSVCLVMLAFSICYLLLVARDRKTLQDHVLRLHVVGASNSEDDQIIKERVRDAVLEKLRTLTSGATTKAEAQEILSENLLKLQNIADDVLVQSGVSARASVTLKKEAFPKRDYDTFTLPSGVYDSLRIVIGEGAGRNWWCVVFPDLCVPAASEEVAEVAASAGFSDGLGKTLTGEEGYEIRFFLLDAFGWLENFFFEC